MSDEDPTSLLFLCDDTIREILSYMPVKSRVRHSRTCTAVYHVVDQSLLTVKSLHDVLWFQSRHIKSKIHTLSKLKNLTSLTSHSESQSDGVMRKIVSVMVANCHYVHHIENWDLKYIVRFVKQLIKKGVPVRLETIKGFYHKKQRTYMKFLMEETKVRLAVTTSDFPFIQMTNSWHRVVEVYGMDLDHIQLPLEKMTDVKKLTGRRLFSAGYEEFAKRVFQSLPQLEELSVGQTNGSGNCLLQTLLQADQEFESIEILQRFMDDEPEDLDMDLLKRLLEKRGPKLKKLTFEIRVRDPTSEEMMQILNLISATCTRLVTFSFAYSQSTQSNTLIFFRYEDRRLLLCQKRDDVSLLPVLNLLPDVRKITVTAACLTVSRKLIPQKMMRELQKFAKSKKKFCIHVVMGNKFRSFGGKNTFIGMEGNVRLYRHK